MNAMARGAALIALCVGMAACAPRGSSVGYPSSYGAADPSRYSRYDGSAYNYSDGSDPNYYNYTSRGAYNGGAYNDGYGNAYGGGGYYVAPPPPRYAYDPYYDTYTPRTYYRNVEPGWYDRWGRWHPSRGY